ELYKKLTSLPKVKKEIDNFDVKTFSTPQILEVVLAGAMSNRASDVHFEAEEKSVRLRYRVDGLLHDVSPDFSKQIYSSLLSRIKLLSDLKLNVTDQPQDGRFTIGLEDKEIELRVSIIPSEFGETVVIRILDPSAIQLKLSNLGLRSDDLVIIEEELKSPNGMILNTGPTGSGKTTTLYAFLLHKRTPEIKIITVEDPIEYHLEDIEQTQVNPEAKYTFASGLRSIMRQDPDIILVGEIRDEETGQIAVQASLTGHLVFSTVHANSAAGAIPRLLDLKVKPASIGPALNLVIAQRLVRRLCENCKTVKKVTPDIKKKIEKALKSLPPRVDRKNYENIKFYSAKGCSKCGNLGYKGRVAIFELLKAEEKIEELVSAKVTEAGIYKEAIRQGMVTMQQDGILKVISGITTFEEVEGVTGPIKW
ncbi:MAG: GspE/PulE family protein, partial [Patescibacteria group bacterium]